MATASPFRTLARERIFYTGMSVALFAAMFYGFSRSFFLSPLFPDWPAPPEAFFYFHGAVFTAWFALLILQPALVAAGRTDIHRKSGVAGAALAVLMIALGVYGSLIAAARPGGFIGIPIPPLEFLVVPFADLALFALFIGLAVRWRRDAQRHKRLMLIGAISIIVAAIVRWPLVQAAGGVVPAFIIQDLFLLPLIGWDMLSRGRPHPVTLWAGGLLIASQPLRMMLGGTRLWQDFAAWAVGFVQ